MGRMSKIMVVVLCFGIALTIGFGKSAIGGEGSKLNCMHPDTMRTKLGEAMDKIFKKGINKEVCQFNLADELKSINASFIKELTVSPGNATADQYLTKEKRNCSRAIIALILRFNTSP